MQEFGKCSCGRTIAVQRMSNDPRIWACMACKGRVCDYCYHLHYEKEHLPARVDVSKKP